MALRLYLLRHAQAENGRLDQDDIDRTLTAKGLEDSKKLGDWLRQQNMATPPANGANHAANDQNRQVIFDHIYCSTAKRTKQTLAQTLQDVATEISFESTLYNASASTILGLLQYTADEYKQIMMVSHNPGISQLATSLAVRGDQKLIHDVTLSYEPCTCSVFEFDCTNWQEAGAHNSTIIKLWTA